MYVLVLYYVCMYSVSPVCPHLLSMVQCARDLFHSALPAAILNGAEMMISHLYVVRKLGTGTYVHATWAQCTIHNTHTATSIRCLATAAHWNALKAHWHHKAWKLEDVHGNTHVYHNLSQLVSKFRCETRPFCQHYTPQIILEAVHVKKCPTIVRDQSLSCFSGDTVSSCYSNGSGVVTARVTARVTCCT